MMEELADNVEHEEVPGCGHWMAEEAPEAFVKVLVDWMNKLRK
jgi:pimeloyl-ACP methyl ester carboxylesterase